MLKRLSPSTRISLGMTAAVVGVLFLAEILGLLPDIDKAKMAGRAQMCEALALSSSAQLMRNDFAGLEAILRGVCQRNPDVLSAGVRNKQGVLLVNFNDHDAQWVPLEDVKSTDTQMQVPIYSKADEMWGTVEFRFKPLRLRGISGYVTAPMVVLVGFVSQICLLCFSLLLKLALRHLNPSKVVPQRVRDALDNLAEGLLILDTKDHILLANNAFAATAGLDPEKMVGKRATKLAWDVEPGFVFPWKQAMEQEKAVANSRLKMKAGDGSIRTFSVNCSPLVGHQGKFCGVMATFDDVTVLEETNVQLGLAKKAAEEAQQAAEFASRAKSEFLANMSHEIRTPLNAVLGFTDVLRRGMEDDPEKRVGHLNTIHASGSHLLELINDILDLSKIEAGKLELETTDCSPFTTMFDVVNVLHVRAQQKGITLTFELDGGIPETIQSDPTRLRQVLMNLAGNAIKFTEKGGVRIICSLETRPDQQWMRLDVVDSGIGMTPEQLQKLFKPFEQADNTVTRRFGGTGLGLSISKRIANAMGGDIVVSSVMGQGSTFRVQIPVGKLIGVKLIGPEEGAQLVRQRQAEAPANKLVRIKPSKVLLVDDGESNRELASLVLRRIGITVVEATNGREALEAVNKQPFDLVLMDMQMPIMDGYTAARKMREMGMQIPIVALTANAMRGDEEKCKAAGCSDFLTKPININALTALLAEKLGTAPEPVAPPTPVTSVTPPPQAAPPQTPPAPPAKPMSKPIGKTQPPAGAKPTTRPAAAPTAAKPPRRIVSSFPLDDPEMRMIVQKFVHNLAGKLSAMSQAFDARDFSALSDHAHWLKGAGGTVGFAEFTEPAKRLETLAKNQSIPEIGPAIDELVELAHAIDLGPEIPAPSPPLMSTPTTSKPLSKAKAFRKID